MAGVTFSEQEIKKLILALAGSKGVEVEDEKPESEDMSEGKDSEEKSEGKPFDSEGESTKDMLVRKMKEKGSK